MSKSLRFVTVSNDVRWLESVLAIPIAAPKADAPRCALQRRNEAPVAPGVCQ